MKIIKAMVFTLSMGWSILLMAFAYRANASELTILFLGLMGITYIFARKGEKE